VPAVRQKLHLSSCADFRDRLSAIYTARFYVRNGGLLSYGPDFGDIFRPAAPYVDRVLRGTKPADLPVQLPVKFQMAINLKTAKSLGLAVPQSILLRADEVIE
jgi:putative ABC transport system substrate-binding protein